MTHKIPRLLFRARPGWAPCHSVSQNEPCVQIIMSSWNNGDPTPVFNNAAQVWNHTFFWEGMAPNAGGKPSGDIGAAIDKSFGSFDAFKEQFAAAGATQFGSGWAWLVADKDGSLEIVKTPNAVNGMVQGATMLFIVLNSSSFFVLDVSFGNS